LKKKRKLSGFIVLLLITVLLFIADILLGSVRIRLSDFAAYLLNDPQVPDQVVLIIEEFRFPKAIAAILAGMALSVSGMQMQTIFRNPLAGPYVLGISSVAGLGVAIVAMGLTSFVSFSAFSLFREWAIILASLAGSGIVLLLILVISRKIRDNIFLKSEIINN